MKLCNGILLVIIISLFNFSGFSQSLPDNIDISSSSNGVVDLPSNVPSAFISDGFVKYTKISCPNGRSIHFVAQSNISEAQIIRARSIMEFYLKDVPSSQYGSNKSAVINTMGEKKGLQRARSKRWCIHYY
jgi:hypothetical protein